MKVTASLKNYGRPARKMRDLISPIKGLPVKKALAQLKTISRYGARDLEILIKSALANAKNNYNLDGDSLIVEDLIIDNGTVLKRWMPRAYGNANRILKRTCSLTVVLDGVELKSIKKKVKNVETVKKEEKKSVEKEVKNKEDAIEKEKDVNKKWQEEKSEKKVISGQSWAKKVFRRKSF